MGQNCPICMNEYSEGMAVCPHCGYHLGGSTQKFTPVNLQGAENAAAAIPQRFELKIVRGPQTGVDIELHEGTLSMGRDPQCDVFLNDMTVSRNHAEIKVDATGCIIRDLNSFNGVWVNDRMVDICKLKTGDVIQLGAFCLVYRERP